MKTIARKRNGKKIYPVIIEQDEDGIFVGIVPTLKSCYTQGATKEEVLHLLQTEVIPLCEESLKEEHFSNSYVEIRELELNNA